MFPVLHQLLKQVRLFSNSDASTGLFVQPILILACEARDAKVLLEVEAKGRGYCGEGVARVGSSVQMSGSAGEEEE